MVKKMHHVIEPIVHYISVHEYRNVCCERASVFLVSGFPSCLLHTSHVLHRSHGVWMQYREYTGYCHVDEFSECEGG